MNGVVFGSVKEEVFWRNYFYRVSLIKQSAQLTALAAQQQQKDGEDGGASVSPEDDVLKGQILSVLQQQQRHSAWPFHVLFTSAGATAF